jgi:hypothetical protein
LYSLPRYRTAAGWVRRNPILRGNEPGFESDTGKLKIGDGTKTWSQLSYADVAPFTLPHTEASIGGTSSFELPDYLTPHALKAAYQTAIVVRPTGAVDDTEHVQNLIDQSSDGSTLLFDGVCPVSETIRFRSRRAYIGTGVAQARTSGLRQVAGANITGGIFVAEAWANNSPSCDEPVLIDNLFIDGNRTANPSSNAHGIVLCNYWSTVSRSEIDNVPRDAIRLTDVTASGVVVDNSASENRILHNRLENGGRHGIAQVCANQISNQDGFCAHNLISNVAGDGIVFQRGSGWHFDRNHLYDIGGNGIFLDNCYATTVVNNEVEDFGSAAVAGDWFSGITVVQLDVRGTIVIGNFVGCRESRSDVGGYQYLSVSAGVDQSDAQAIVSNNLIKGPTTPTNKGLGLNLEVRSGGQLHTRVNDNRISDIHKKSFYGPGVRLYKTDSVGQEHPAFGAAMGSYNGPALGSGAPGSVVAGSDFSGTFAFGTGSAPAAGVFGGVDFDTDYGTPPVVLLFPGNPATAELGVLSPSPGIWGFDISVERPPLADQPSGTYVIQYIIQG